MTDIKFSSTSINAPNISVSPTTIKTSYITITPTTMDSHDDVSEEYVDLCQQLLEENSKRKLAYNKTWK